jgi:hypothetical protein
LTYIIHIATTFLAFLFLAKDWQSHRKSWRRLTVIGLIILIGIGGLVNTHYANKKIDQDQNRIAALKQAVDTANKNQEDNTKQFVNAFGKLSQKVSDLQTQVKTAGLKEEADQLANELRATQKAMTAPKVTLTFSFARARRDGTILRTVTLPAEDGVVHAEFNLINDTEVAAQNGEVTVGLCDACTFASEPAEFHKLPGQRNNERIYYFDRILPKTTLKTMSVDIKVPADASGVEFVVGYRCINCIVPEPKANNGFIIVSR